MQPRSVYTSIQNGMKCGIGKCGRYNVGAIYKNCEFAELVAVPVSQIACFQLIENGHRHALSNHSEG